MAYLSVRLYPIDLETPTDEYLTEKGMTYMHQTRTSGGAPETLWYAVGYPNRFLRTGSSSPQINPSRFKIGFILHKASSSAATPIVLNAFVFSLRDPNNIPFLRTGSRGYSFSSTGVSINYNTGVTDAKTGLPIYFSSISGQYNITDTAANLIFPSANYIYTQNDYYTTSDPRIIPTDLMNEINDGVWDYESFDYSDPYAGGGLQPTSETGGGEGTFTDVNTPIDFPPLPTISVVDTGFITLFNPTETQLKNLANYMWTNPLFDLTNWKALFANPMDCILSLALLPVAIPNGGSDTVKVGNISTDVTMVKAAQQFIDFDCGTITIPEKWGCYLDYTPYTKLSIFLPFIGVHDLQADEVMNKSIHLKYQIDIFTGACSAFIKCGDSVLYTYTGQCGFTVPISGNDYTSIVSGILSSVGAIGSVAVSGGMTAPAAVSSIFSTVQNTFASKPNVSHGSGLSGNSGFLSVRTPYLILTRPNLCLPANQNTFLGYPVYITDTLSNLSGFTVVENIFFNDFSGTTDEQDELIEILKNGVII